MAVQIGDGDDGDDEASSIRSKPSTWSKTNNRKTKKPLIIRLSPLPALVDSDALCHAMHTVKPRSTCRVLIAGTVEDDGAGAYLTPNRHPGCDVVRKSQSTNLRLYRGRLEGFVVGEMDRTQSPPIIP
ncbi:hypothetical protein FRB95_012055 [Tulasnella sp. JGI-2019a]|nr:hypothetical protein FRB93_010352 [Tulasnella sp. JGI-2019a]KAG9024120.1 hypothetical protein FRB95_012055 [Tulasnella sp. JGI-2019a]